MEVDRDFLSEPKKKLIVSLNFAKNIRNTKKKKTPNEIQNKNNQHKHIRMD